MHCGALGMALAVTSGLNRMKLLPNYSVRAALAWLAVCGAAFFVVSLGYRGLRYATVSSPYGERGTLVPEHDWAVWLSALILVVAVVLGTHAAFFLLLGGAEVVARALRGPRPEEQTPFRPERPAQLPVSDVPLVAGAKEPLRLLPRDVHGVPPPPPGSPPAAPPPFSQGDAGRTAVPPPPPGSASVSPPPPTAPAADRAQKTGAYQVRQPQDNAPPAEHEPPRAD